MNEMLTPDMEAGMPMNSPSASGCPVLSSMQTALLDEGDELVLPKHKRVVAQYSTNAAGTTELHLYYGDKEISFDQPALFAFGETLAKQSRFMAGAATRWGTGYDWLQVRELLETLVNEGVLQRADTLPAEPVPHLDTLYASPLPPAAGTLPRTWFECDSIMRELTGQPLEMGYLELIVPVFRIAHIALDADGRQVGEANVFPKPLRLEVPTEWRACPYAGSRFQMDRPMNSTALKAMAKHWPQIMALLLRLRAAFLERFPHARNGWTVGDLERLSSLVLALPAYLLMRAPGGVQNGQLHPVLSSLFRVTDGLRMTMHQMLFLPLGEATRPPQTPMTGAQIYEYAERNYVFFSDHGVCAGPKTMIEEFLNVVVEGRQVKGSAEASFDAEVQSALDTVASAFDYGLTSLQAYAVVFTRWPMMARAYEQVWATLESWSTNFPAGLREVRERFQSNIEFLRAKSLLGTEVLRVSREQAYADMYAHCAVGLGLTDSAEMTLSECIAPSAHPQHAQAAQQLRAVLRRRGDVPAAADCPQIEALVGALIEYFRREQAIVRAAVEIQQRINRLLGRAQPMQPLSAASLDLYNKLQGQVARLPDLSEELGALLGIRIVVTEAALQIFENTDSTNPANMGLAKSTCDGHG